MAKIRWYVQTDKVGSKMERDFDAEDFYDVRDDGTTELNERAVDEAVKFYGLVLELSRDFTWFCRV